MQLGFVGTGTMGAAMAGCLIEAGHQLTLKVTQTAFVASEWFMMWKTAFHGVWPTG